MSEETPVEQTETPVSEAAEVTPEVTTEVASEVPATDVEMTPPAEVTE